MPDLRSKIFDVLKWMGSRILELDTYNGMG